MSPEKVQPAPEVRRGGGEDTPRPSPANSGDERMSRKRSRLRHLLSDGVLPEALGLGFVVIVFAGFASAYLIAAHGWQQQARQVRQAEADTLCQVLATTLGRLTEVSPEELGANAAAGAAASAPAGLADLAAQLGRSGPLVYLRWSAPDGSTRLVWPVGSSTLPGAVTSHTPSALVSQAPVTSPSGTPAGQLQLALSEPDGTGFHNAFTWNWGIASGVTLLVFTVVYRRLRRHLRPVAAIERSLHSYASGLERELLALRLSDSLGSMAQGWNRLLSELADMQQRLQSAQNGGATSSVLERFESTLFRRIVDRLPWGVLCLGENQRVGYANATAAALLGRNAEELGGQPLEQVLADEHVLRAVTQVRDGLLVGQTVDYVRGEGEQETALRFRIQPLSRQSGGDVLVTVEDIAPLREGQRARDNFLYHVTHELRTPLTNIHAYAETLTKPDFDDEQTRKECYNVIVSETRRLSSLVENILSISQLEVGTARLDIGEVDLQRLLRQMVQDNLGAADEKRIDLSLVLPPKVPKIRGDKQRLSVLLNNLIGNAIKYTPAGGKVQVKLELGPHNLSIAVSDTGIGIAPADQPHVFEKFYRAADESVQNVPGTGLGLAIAREVARLHGGDITLQSAPGKGSTFTVELPLPAVQSAEVSGT